MYNESILKQINFKFGVYYERKYDMANGIEDEETVWITIGNKELAFTAIHLVEIQAILELEKDLK